MLGMTLVIDELLCVFVQFADGSRYWVVKRDYETNPPLGSFIVNDKPNYPKPLVRL